MAFHEVLFPLNISYGSSGGPGYNTSVIVTDSGAEERVARWDNARRRYDVVYNLKDPEVDIPEILKFYLARQGVAIGFRFRDFQDFASTKSGLAEIPGDFALRITDIITNTDQVIGTGNGSATQFQLKKKYPSDIFSKTRSITKPVAGSVVVALDGISQPSGFTVDTTTGIVTFTVAPVLDTVVTAGFLFDVPVRFGEEIDDAIMTSRDNFGIGSVESIPLVELRDELQSDEEFFFGGGAELNLTGDISITTSTGRAINVASTTAGNRIILPTFATLAVGGPYFYISNNDGSDSVDIVNNALTLIKTISAGGEAIIILGLTGAIKAWFAL